MESVGSITISLSKEGDKAIILLSDTGKGISANNQKLIFNPGFTTKKRGWGLGLSLAKRIIENYHSGKIFVKNSKINEGTTFEIHLPTS
jgi:signal transduction histidine kinase